LPSLRLALGVNVPVQLSLALMVNGTVAMLHWPVLLMASTPPQGTGLPEGSLTAITGVQVKAVPAHDPLVQTSFCVQALPSLHVVPLGAFGLEHIPFEGLQVPATWH
jgi:hypothetical protein